MKSDPAIDTIRRAPHQISASVDHDSWKLVEHYRQLLFACDHYFLDKWIAVKAGGLPLINQIALQFISASNAGAVADSCAPTVFHP